MREGSHLVAARPPNATPLALGGPGATKCNKGRTWWLQGNQVQPRSHLDAFGQPSAGRAAFGRCKVTMRPLSHLVTLGPPNSLAVGPPNARGIAFGGCKAKTRPLSHLMVLRQPSAQKVAFGGLVLKMTIG